MGGRFLFNEILFTEKPNWEAQNIKTYLQRQPESSDSMAAGAFGCISSSSSNLCNLRISRSKRERNEDFPNDIYKSYLQIQNSTIELDHAGFMSKSSKVDWALPVSKHSNGIYPTHSHDKSLAHASFPNLGKKPENCSDFPSEKVEI